MRSAPRATATLRAEVRRRGANDMRKYEYKFVRLGEGWLAVKASAKAEYQETIDEHARDGWRLVQIFAPGTGAYGAAKYYELILERELRP